ncbi:MAG: adenosylmethionine--8-amino-7-oxononanoate transaminase [Planctomycetota bacterium]
MTFDADTLRAWDAQHSWHPFTPMQQYLESDPVMIARADGVRLQDTDGNWYFDGTSSVWLNVHGHRVARIDDAIRAQLDQIAHSTMLGQANVPATVLARELVSIVPDGLTRAQFSDSGATAVEIAIKIAIQYFANQDRPEKRRILGFEHNYHGDTLGAMAVAPDALFHWPFIDMLPDHPRAPFPLRMDVPLVTPEMTCPGSAMEPIRTILEREHQQLAAIIIEPVQGAGGIRPAEPGTLRALRELCDSYDVLLIVDEVATGFGRTGWPFACTAEHMTPDLLCLGKGLTGGYLPVAATMATERIYETFLGPIDARRTLYHGHSYAGNQLGCAAALANLELCADLFPRVPKKVHHFTDAVRAFVEAPYAGQIRHRGMMLGIDVVADAHEGIPFHWSRRAGYAVADAARKRGLLVRPIGSTVILMPPLASTESELAEMTSILRGAFDDAAPTLEAWAKAEVATS